MPDRLSTVFAALADPTRRAILRQLSSGEAPVAELARPFAMSLPAVYKHLSVLQRAGLIVHQHRGRWRPRRLGQDVAQVFKETIRAVANGAAKSAGDEYDEKQRSEIIRILQETKGRVGGADGAAARIGIKRTTLLSRMKKFGIHAKQFF